MTIVISPGFAAARAAAGLTNNPMIGWRNRTNGAIFTTTGGVEVEPASNLATPTTFDKWVAEFGGSGFARATVQLASTARVVDCVCLAGHNIGDTGATLEIQTSIDAAVSWQDCGVGPIVPTDNKAICFLFTEAPTTDYWRIKMSGGTTGVEVYIGVAYFTRVLQPPQGIYQGFAPAITPTQVHIQSMVSAGANHLESSVIRSHSDATVNLTHLLPSYIRSTGNNDWRAFQDHFNKGGGAFLMWRPVDFDEDAFYGWRNGPPIVPTNSGPKGYMSANVQMRLFDDS